MSTMSNDFKQPELIKINESEQTILDLLRKANKGYFENNVQGFHIPGSQKVAILLAGGWIRDKVSLIYQP